MGKSAVPGGDAEAEVLLGPILERAQFGFALTRGSEHRVTYANPEFLSAVAAEGSAIGVPVGELIRSEIGPTLQPMLDRALNEGSTEEESSLGRLAGGKYWSCSVWPIQPDEDDIPGLAVELIPATHARQIVAMQREVAGRLLLSALRESEAAEEAEAGRTRAQFLAEAGRKLNESLEEGATRETMTGLDLPNLGAWCIVDLIEPDGNTIRLDLLHPEPRKQELLHELAKQWSPKPGDPFGAPAVSADAPEPVVISGEVDEALEAAAHTADNFSLLRQIGVGAILTVPLLDRDDVLLGALTFMSARRDRAYSDGDVELAIALADRSADALCSAKLYGDALALRERAVAASEERIRLLGTISHELRTPLNAIGGYADILDEGIHGPVTEKQRAAIERIRENQKHLLVLIHDVLEFVRTGTVRAETIVDVSVREAVQRAIELVSGMSRQDSVRISDDPDAVVRGDPDKVHQILVNLLANAVKFTPAGGEIRTAWEVTGARVRIHVTDDGIGVPEDKLEAIFEPFVRLGGDEGKLGSAGMGLSISRDLARAMGGDLTIESELGEGSCFTLSLPRASAAKSG